MAIAPSKLGRLIADNRSFEDTLVCQLRENGLVKPGLSDDEIKDTFTRALEEHARIDEGMRSSIHRTSACACSPRRL